MGRRAPALPWVTGIDHVELTGHRSDTTTVVTCDSAPDCTCSPDHYMVPHDEGCPSLIPSPVTDEHRAALEQAARDALHAAWEAGEREYEYKTGEERAREVADDYEFTVDGVLSLTRTPTTPVQEGNVGMLTPEVEQFARSHNGEPNTTAIDDVIDEVAVEFKTEEAATTFAAAAREKSLHVIGPWRWDLSGFPHMVTIYADSE